MQQTGAKTATGLFLHPATTIFLIALCFIAFCFNGAKIVKIYQHTYKRKGKTNNKYQKNIPTTFYLSTNIVFKYSRNASLYISPIGKLAPDFVIIRFRSTSRIILQLTIYERWMRIKQFGKHSSIFLINRQKGDNRLCFSIYPHLQIFTHSFNILYLRNINTDNTAVGF